MHWGYGTATIIVEHRTNRKPRRNVLSKMFKKMTCKVKFSLIIWSRPIIVLGYLGHYVRSSL